MNEFGTPVASQPIPNLNDTIRPKKTRNSEHMDQSPEIKKIESDEFERMKSAMSKIFSLQLRVEQQDATIRTLSNTIRELTERLGNIENLRCNCRCNNQNFINEISKEIKESGELIAKTNLCYKSAVLKSIRGKTNEPVPPQQPVEINVVNSVMVEQRERESKNRNLIIHGIELSRSEKGDDRKKEDESRIEEIFDALKVKKSTIKSITRFKNKSNDVSKIPPILVELQSAGDRSEVLSVARGLHKIDRKYEKVYLNADLTEAERVFEKQLREEKNNLNIVEERDKTGYKWIILNGKIVRVKILTEEEKNRRRETYRSSENGRKNQTGSTRGGFRGRSTSNRVGKQ